MTQEEKTKLEERIVDVLKTVYDPEIPVNIYDLGMIYKIDVQEDASVDGYDLHSPQLSRCRLYIRRCTHEGRERRRHRGCQCQSRLRACLGSEYDERRSSCRVRT